MNSSTFDLYIKNKQTNSTNKKQYTHTKIGDKSKNIFGGCFIIPQDEKDKFWKLYFQHVFKNGKKEYLTERQLFEDGPILIDIDMRYENTIETKQHTHDDVLQLVGLYMEHVSSIYKIDDKTEVSIFVMEKKDVNKLEDITKDGIHIIIGIKSDKPAQVLLRNKVLQDMDEIWGDLPLTNTWDQVIDDGITKGSVNWQMYGSRKPGYERYNLKYYYTAEFSSIDEDWEFENNGIETFNIEQNIQLLSAQYNKHVQFDIKDEVMNEYENIKKQMSKKRENKVKKKVKLKAFTDINSIDYESISNMKELDMAIENMCNPENYGKIGYTYELKETHEYTMILPKSYYGPGSYTKWIRVGWALKNTSPMLFITWLKFSSQSEEFSFDQVSDMWDKWENFNNNKDGLTNRSIMYWCRNDVSKQFKKVQESTVDYYVEEAIERKGLDYDLANVLFQLYKDKYICASYSNGIWFEYDKGRWVEGDGGVEISKKISNEIWKLFLGKLSELLDQLATKVLNNFDESVDTEQIRKKIQAKQNTIYDIMDSLKKTPKKKNIMKQALELFYDKDFYNKLDKNEQLLCFNNYIVDFEKNEYRMGKHDDYISLCTGIDYIPIDIVKQKYMKEHDEIIDFIAKLFPNENLRKYMWEHLASCLIGTNENQTFNIYCGSGANGKSKLVELMSLSLGDYKGIVPITLITQKRTSIGSTSSEVVQLKGRRYAVMQEPEKRMQINEGIMKEITGGDDLQGRALWKETITFKPQFTLAVCTNTLFDIKSNDDGTWRRIRVSNFESKFLSKPYKNEKKFPRELYPFQYKKDTGIDKKFKKWAPVFMSMLIEIVYKTKGKVTDCDEVLMVSNKYRENQDHFSGFMTEKIKEEQGAKIKKTELSESFKEWYMLNHGRGVPKPSELFEKMNQRYGVYIRGGWHNVKLIYDEDSDDEY